MVTRTGTRRGTRWRLRVSDVSAIVALDLASAALCLYGVLRPASPETPVRMNACLAVIALGFASAIWRAAPQLRRRLISLNIVVHVLGTSVAVMSAATGEGAVSAAVSYVLLTLYVASFLPPTALRVHIPLVVIGSGTAIHASDVIANPVPTWLPIVTAVVVSGYLFSSHVDEMRRLSVTDPLTGALNRTGMADAIVREQAETARSGRPSSIVVVDLDGFKAINDERGHAAGDALLVHLVTSWRALLRPRDLIVRRGGDEFVLLLPATDEDEARHVLERLRSVSGVAWSSGIAHLGARDDPEQVLRLADTRMYECKHGTVRPEAVPSVHTT